MKEEIVVNKVSIKEKRIEILFDVTEGLKPYFNSTQRVFWVDYSIDISNVPTSIAILPFVCNVLPIIWLKDAVLQIPSLDKTFYESVPEFKRGYEKMYPMLAFRGAIETKLEDCSYVTDGGNAAFFSGGVDAFATLIAHRNEHPLLITLRGADIKLDDNGGWNNVYNHIQNTVKQFHLPTPITITSSFRTFIDEGELSQLVSKSGDGWWHGFQHGIGLLGHAAPVAYINHIEWVYIASTFPVEEKNITCASHYTIDNYVRFSNSRVLHDQVELFRQGKIHLITQYCKTSKQYVDLRVCWISTGGKNCCHCEKCIRTMFGIMAEGEDPSNYGFNYTKKELEDSKKIIVNTLFDSPEGVRREWPPIIKRFLDTGAYKNDKRVNWVYKLDPYAKRPKHSIFKRIKNKLYRILH